MQPLNYSCQLLPQFKQANKEHERWIPVSLGRSSIVGLLYDLLARMTQSKHLVTTKQETH